MDGISGRTNPALRVALITVLSAATWGVPRTKGDPAAQANQPVSRVMEGREEQQRFDGAISRIIVFQDRNRTFRYTPPAGWEFAAHGGSAVLKRGRVLANLKMSATESKRLSDRALPTPEEQKTFQQQTTEAAAAKGEAAAPSVLPIKAGNQTLLGSTVTFGTGGQRRVLQRFKSFGGDWQLDLEISGAADVFAPAAAQVLQSICSIEARSEQVRQLETAAREKEVLASIAAEQTKPKTVPVGKTRGRLP